MIWAVLERGREIWPGRAGRDESHRGVIRARLTDSIQVECADVSELWCLGHESVAEARSRWDAERGHKGGCADFLTSAPLEPYMEGKGCSFRTCKGGRTNRAQCPSSLLACGQGVVAVGQVGLV